MVSELLHFATGFLGGCQDGGQNAAFLTIDLLWWQVQLQLRSGNSSFWWQAQLEGDRATTPIWELAPSWKATGPQLQSRNLGFWVAGPVGK